MPRVLGRRAEFANRHDDAQPSVGAVVITPAAQGLHHLAGLCRRIVAVLLNPSVCGAAYFSVGNGHSARIPRGGRLTTTGDSNRIRRYATVQGASRLASYFCPSVG